MPFRALDPSTAVAAPAVAVAAPLVNVGETLGSLRAELILQLGSREQDVTRLNKWINWAYLNLCGMLKIHELESSLVINLVIGQPFYLIPIQVRSITELSVRDSTRYVKGGIDLVGSDLNEYRRLPDNAAYTPFRSPLKWFRFRRMLVFFPDPLYVLPVDMEFMIRPDLLVADTDSPIIPQEFHEPLLLHSVYRGWRTLRNYPEAKEAANNFLAALRPLIDTDAEEQDDTPRGLTVARRASDLHRARRY